jgi:Leucine-rich repeat (LRR) protein
MGGCTAPNEEIGMDDGYGYVQFKLYKKASYKSPESGTKAASNAPLEWLADAYKVRVLLGYGDNEITQTLTLTGGEGDAAEWGLRSGKLKLITGDYTLLNYTLYDAEDKEIYSNIVTENNTFTIVGGGLVMQDITVNVVARGKVQFNLKKEIEDITRAVEREYTFDEIHRVSIYVKEANAIDVITIAELPCDFDVHFDTSDEVEDGYKTSSIKCDSLVWLPAGHYDVVRYEAFAKDGNLLESNSLPKKSSFEIKDNEVTTATVGITLRQSDAYIQDYYALKAIWESLDGKNWYYVGEEQTKGANWNFNKDVDLWGDQPGVKLHANGRVAFIDISGFGFRGHLSPRIGDLTELVELYLGTHNDQNVLYDPTLDRSKSLAERSRDRMKNHGEWLRTIHTPIQMSEPCAMALAENGISIPATKLYDTMRESDFIDTKSGAQRANITLMDTSHGTLCNGLESLPEEIGNLTKLEYLYIANSAISSIPASISKLESLTDFELYNCPNMTEFPVAIAEIPGLVSLNIANNAQWSAEEIYKGLDALATGASKESIQILYCRQGNLKELPESFKNMKKLGLLDLAFNKIEKVHPLGKEVSFVQLYLDYNNITELPKDEEGYFCGYDDVETFSVNYNRLTKVPNIFDANNLYTMASVSFAGNQIDGFEGEEDGSYKGIKVETFTLSQNKFKSYPMAIANTNSTVAYIILRANEISDVPRGAFTYKNSVNMTSLDLSYNKISDLPWDMHAGNLPYLYGVDMSFNSFSEFPYEPLDASSLTVFALRSQRDANGNRCMREWPTGIGNHRGLRGLYLGSNDLRVIDDSISTLIYYLDISDNPNIVFDASDICYAWSVGAYILIYDRSQNILNCSAMLQ